MKKPRFGINRYSLLATVGLALACVSSGAFAQDTIKIGQFTSLTGPSAVVGQDMQRGVKLAADRINDGYDVPMQDGSTVHLGPGLLGKKVQVIVEDAESRPKGAMDAVRKLVNVDNVPVVLGEYSSGLTLPTGQFTNKNHIVQISIGANSPKLRDVGPYFFDMIGLNNLEGPPMVNLAMKAENAKTFATIVPNNPYGVGLEEGLCDTAENNGGKCVARVRYDNNQTDYRAQLRQISRPKPDAVFFFAYGSDATLLLRQASELGMDVSGKWFGPEMSNWVSEVSKNENISKIADGVRGIVLSVGGDFYDKEYAQPFEKAFGEKPASSFGAFGYDAMMVAALAIHDANSTDPEKIKDAIPAAAEKYKGLTGTKAVDKDGMQKNADFDVKVYRDGALHDYSPGS
ncbi:MAG TPA: ABC transporter substrate-binding protein [Gammaproteobacteria bacterium]|nr:ABC transporter substrate-binding protein [Gammaproteobacteria bacterium]